MLCEPLPAGSGGNRLAGGGLSPNFQHVRLLNRPSAQRKENVSDVAQEPSSHAGGLGRAAVQSYVSTCHRVRSLAGGLFEMQGVGPRLLPMEGMRGLSAFLVFFVHFWPLFGSRAGGATLRKFFEPMATLGHCGVDVFFALSGFIIYGLLLKKDIPYWKFVRRRVIRLYPAFVAVFLAYLFLSLAVPDRSKIPHSFFPALTYLVSNFLMLPGIFPITPMIIVAWSLSYELCFYLTMPVLFRCLKLGAWPKDARIGFFLAASVAWLLLPAGLMRHPRMVMFGCGILLYETIGMRSRFLNYAAPVMFLATLVVIGLRGQTTVTSNYGPVLIHSTLHMVLLFIATFALGYSALGDSGWLSKAFSWDWLRWFGNISYSYYLFHGLVLHFVRVAADAAGLPARLSPVAFVALCAICFATTVAGSAGLFLAVEKRFSFRTQAVRSAAAPSAAQA